MSFKDTQSYKELQADWRWIHSMDPEAAAAADQWVKEHPEEWKGQRSYGRLRCDGKKPRIRTVKIDINQCERRCKHVVDVSSA